MVCLFLPVLWTLVAGSFSSCPAAIYQVGPSRDYKTLQEVVGFLQPGDVVEVDGDHLYPGGVVLNRAGTPSAKIHLKGIRVNGRRPILSGGVNVIAFVTPWPYNVPEGGHHYLLEGFEISNASNRGIYHQAKDLTVRDCLVYDCRNGILGADQGSGSLVLEYTEITRCGSGGSAHQIYMATDQVNNPGSVFRMQHCYVHSGHGGNHVKSRAERNEIYHNWMEGAFYHELELIGPDQYSGADGGNPLLKREDSDVVGNVLIKRQTDAGNNPDFYVIRIGGDGTGESHGRYRFLNNTIISGTGAVFRMFHALESVEIQNNVLYNPTGPVTFQRTTEANWVTGQAVISGKNNWIKTGALQVPTQLIGTVSGNSPQFLDLEQNQLEPAPGSPLVDAGTLPTTPPAGFEFPNPLSSPLKLPPARAIQVPEEALDRVVSGQIDIGAFEYHPSALLTITATAGDGGSVTPDSRNILSGTKASFTVAPNAGYIHGPVGGSCSTGSWVGHVYTTPPLMVSCSIHFNFVAIEAGGALQVTLEPEEVRMAQARWRRLGTDPWYDSGTVEGNIPPGTYLIEFSPISGWEGPARPSLSIGPGPRVVFTGYYSPIRANVQHVDANNQTERQEGTPQYPYRSLQSAIDHAATGDTIKVAVGTYGHITSKNKALSLLGGYPGASPAAYSAGQGGDFNLRALDPGATSIRGGLANDGVTFTRNNHEPYFGVLDNVAVRGNRKGIVCDTQQSWPHPDNLTISNCIVENNGQEGDGSTRGAGIVICGQRASILNCIIRGNHGGWGPGISGGTSLELLVDGNVIENNVLWGDHGGGLQLHGNIVLSHNRIAGNRIAWNYGWGGGVFVHGLGTLLKTFGNTIRDNYAPSYGGGVFIDETATAHLHHDLIVHNRTLTGTGGGVAVDNGYDGPSNLSMNHCTVAFNNADFIGDPYWLGGNGVFVDNDSIATITNSIFWGNGDDFYVRQGSAMYMVYSLSQEPWHGTGNLTDDPLFAEPAAGDFHLQSTGGRYHPETGTWVKDLQHSPAIDAGDPAAPFGNEPQPNGARVNMGAFGHTGQASNSGGKTRYVSRTPGCHGKAPCFPSIADALLASEDGDIILVEQGFHHESPVRNMPGRVTLSGGWNETFTAQTGATEIRAPRVTGGGTIQVMPRTTIVGQ